MDYGVVRIGVCDSVRFCTSLAGSRILWHLAQHVMTNVLLQVYMKKIVEKLTERNPERVAEFKAAAAPAIKKVSYSSLVHYGQS